MKEAVAKIEKKKLSKEEQRLLRQEKDPNFKDKNQPKAKRQKKGSQVKPENTAESVKNEEPSVQMKDEIGPSASSSLQQNSTNGAKERGNSGKRKTGLGFTENDSKRAKTDSLASPSATLRYVSEIHSWCNLELRIVQLWGLQQMSVKTSNANTFSSSQCVLCGVSRTNRTKFLLECVWGYIVGTCILKYILVLITIRAYTPNWNLCLNLNLDLNLILDHPSRLIQSWDDEVVLHVNIMFHW